MVRQEPLPLFSNRLSLWNGNVLLMSKVQPLIVNIPKSKTTELLAVTFLRSFLSVIKQSIGSHNRSYSVRKALEGP